MATWFTAYCTRSVQQVAATDIRAAFDAVDFLTVAEGFGIEDEVAVKRAVSALRVEPAAGGLGEWFEIRYRPTKHRPLIVYRWADSARVRKELTETEENHLAGRRERGVSAVRKTLAGVVEVVAVELGLVHLEDGGLVIAGQVAEYLAEVGAGPIRDTGDEWWVVRDRVPKLLLGRP